MQICQGKTRTGAACRAPAGSGGLCFFHANPDSARALGQIGWRKNRRSAVVDLQVPDDMTAADLRNVTAQAMRLLLSGDLHAREASALAHLCNSLYRVIPTADLEARVTMLEQQVAQEESGTRSDLDSSTVTPTHGTEASETDAELVTEQQVTTPIDTPISAPTHYEDEAESTSDGSGEGGEA
jgi:hypothetical protein